MVTRGIVQILLEPHILLILLCRCEFSLHSMLSLCLLQSARTTLLLPYVLVLSTEPCYTILKPLYILFYSVHTIFIDPSRTMGTRSGAYDSSVLVWFVQRGQ